jgi:uncharacterized protein (UPF0548 family)
MFMLRKPSPLRIDACLRLQGRLPFSYRYAGATRNSDSPPGFRGAVHRVCLGEGAETFQRAKQAIRDWRMFPPEFVEICWPDAPIVAGSTVGILFRTCGLWSLHVCRIVYMIDECDGSIERFGFAYGTLPQHIECGEERFMVEWDRRDDRVWYEVRMFCRPSSWLAWLIDPVVRRLQRRFGRLTKLAMLRAVAETATTRFQTAPQV